MLDRRDTTLTQFLIEERRRHPERDRRAQRADHRRRARLQGDRAARRATARSPACSARRARPTCRARRRQKLDVLGNDIFLRANEWGGHRRRHGVGGDGRALRDPGAVPARQVPAAVRSARRLVEHRRQRLGRQHLLDPARRRRRAPTPTPRTSCSPAREQVCAGYAIYGPSTMLVLTRGHGRARLHARPAARRIRPHPSGDLQIPADDAASSRSTRRTAASGSRR